MKIEIFGKLYEPDLKKSYYFKEILYFCRNGFVHRGNESSKTNGKWKNGEGWKKTQTSIKRVEGEIATHGWRAGEKY